MNPDISNCLVSVWPSILNVIDSAAIPLELSFEVKVRPSTSSLYLVRKSFKLVSSGVLIAVPYTLL
ncbi:hypothetical protein, partial [Metamycoplasma hyosynoviae]|uniref:hypothetical protein n=1 Tax=Metamycoplasma hyosynoviae TaxID=29559 RepID=UPI0023597E61